MSFHNSNHWNRSWVRVNRKLLFGAKLGVEVESTGFGKVLIPNSPNSCPGSKNMFIQNGQKIEGEVMEFGSKEGSLYPTLMFSSNSKVLPSWRRRFVAGGMPGPWLPATETLRRWKIQSLSLKLVPITSCLSPHECEEFLAWVFPNELPKSLPPEDVVASVVVTTAFSSLSKALFPWLTVYFPPW